MTELLEQKDLEISELIKDLNELSEAHKILSDKYFALMKDMQEMEDRYDEMATQANEWMEIALSLKEECIRLSKEVVELEEEVLKERYTR